MQEKNLTKINVRLCKKANPFKVKMKKSTDLMSRETLFTKYFTRGATYHWEQINRHDIRKFNAFVYARYIKHIQEVEKYLATRKNARLTLRLLDVGCGSGVLLYLMKENIEGNLEFYGIDLSEEALEIARKKMPGETFQKASAYALPFPDNYFDIIVSADVIEHLVHPRKMLDEIRRAGKKDSLVVIGTNIRLTERPLDKNHHHELFPEEFFQLASEYLNETKLTESHDLLYLLLYQKPINVLGKSITLFRYLINILSIFFGKNPFLATRSYKHQLFAYILISGKNKK